MLDSALTSKSVLASTIKAMLSRRRLIALGCRSHFKLSKAAAKLAGSSMSSRNRAGTGSAGFGIMRLYRRKATRRREGSSRESQKDYLHFLYIARGSLSETQYFVHLSQRLGYLSKDQAEALQSLTKRTFGCLHGLIKAVEKEAGKLNKVIAAATSLLVIGLVRWSFGHTVP